ncbi:hypothetical protein DPMN_012678 [Dreissena polymorpha]|uniref:Uncharacterized protein n=1 Tax=Dreissena polymorpha TaxID=45954 RepID=A0A9D4N688_DREPO|nr:hypothetical protein DPMN_012678 [Dreissena polymorpha]
MAKTRTPRKLKGMECNNNLCKKRKETIAPYLHYTNSTTYRQRRNGMQQQSVHKKMKETIAPLPVQTIECPSVSHRGP